VAAFPPSAASSASLTGHHRTRFIHYKRAAHKIPAIACLDSAIGSAIVVDFYESEPASLARKAIAHHVDAVDSDTGLRKEICYVGFRRRIWKVSDE
jgi:hypothetical protein